MSARFATLQFDRQIAVPVATLWQVWTAPAARAVWAAPSAAVTVEVLEAETRVGGREVSLCKVEGQPDIRVECGWLDLRSDRRSVNHETVSCEGQTLSVALVTAELEGTDSESRLAVTVQLSSLAEDLEPGYRQGFAAGLDNLVAVAGRTMVIRRTIAAPRPVVWGAWVNPRALPQWWGPDGFSCRTHRIDLKTGGEWVFDMIAPDGTVFPNHHRYRTVLPERGIEYALLWGENGPKHADAWVSFEDEGDATLVTLGMAFDTQEECTRAKGFGAEKLGLQTLGKLAAFIGAG